MENSGKSTRQSLAWTSSAQIIKQLWEFGVGILLSRILKPADFGIIASGMIVYSLISIFMTFGFSTAIIQRRVLEEGYIRTAQTLSVFFGCLAALLLYLAAPLAGSFFHDNFVSQVVRALSLSFVITGFDIVPSSLLTRKMQFDKISIIMIASSFSYGLVSISLAIAGFGVWSLVFGPIASVLIKTIGLSIACSYFPKFGFRIEYSKQLLSFGGFVTISSIINYAARNSDNAIIGRYLGQGPLGLYAKAYNLATISKDALVSAFGNVLLPNFAKHQNDKNSLRDSFLKSINLITLVSLPISVVLLLIAPEFINIIYGTKWSGSIAPLQILSLAGFIYTLLIPCTSLLLALGKTQIYATFQALYSTLIVLFVYCIYTKGIIYVAAVVSASIIISFTVHFFYIKKIISLHWKSVWHSMESGIKGAIIMAFFIGGGKVFFAIMLFKNSILFFFVELFVALISYLIVLLISKDDIVSEIKVLLVNKLKSIIFYAKNP